MKTVEKVNPLLEVERAAKVPPFKLDSENSEARPRTGEEAPSKLEMAQLKVWPRMTPGEDDPEQTIVEAEVGRRMVKVAGEPEADCKLGVVLSIILTNPVKASPAGAVAFQVKRKPLSIV